MRLLVLAFILTTITACSVEPKPIKYGMDECKYCSMKIMDERFGAEAVTEKGKVYTFDSAECLFNYLGKGAHEPHAFLMVTNYLEPQTLMNARDAMFLISQDIPSPMGAFLSSYSSVGDAKMALKEGDGEIFDWAMMKEKYGIAQ